MVTADAERPELMPGHGVFVEETETPQRTVFDVEEPMDAIVPEIELDGLPDVPPKKADAARVPPRAPAVPNTGPEVDAQVPPPAAHKLQAVKSPADQGKKAPREDSQAPADTGELPFDAPPKAPKEEAAKLIPEEGTIHVDATEPQTFEELLQMDPESKPHTGLKGIDLSKRYGKYVGAKTAIASAIDRLSPRKLGISEDGFRELAAARKIEQELLVKLTAVAEQPIFSDDSMMLLQDKQKSKVKGWWERQKKKERGRKHARKEKWEKTKSWAARKAKEVKDKGLEKVRKAKEKALEVKAKIVKKAKEVLAKGKEVVAKGKEIAHKKEMDVKAAIQAAKLLAKLVKSSTANAIIGALSCLKKKKKYPMMCPTRECLSMVKKEDRWAKFAATNCPAIKLQAGMVVAFRGRKDVGRTCRLNGDNINCDRRHVGKHEGFKLEQFGDGYALIAANGRYCADDEDRIRCNREKALGWERFEIEPQSDGGVAIRGGRANRYCADEGHRIICNRKHALGWETFTPTCLEGCNPDSCVIADIGTSPEQDREFRFTKQAQFANMNEAEFEKVTIDCKHHSFFSGTHITFAKN